MTRLRVNGVDADVETHGRAALLWALRDELGYSSVKYGCGSGQCGACRVGIDGALDYSCQMTVDEAAGREVQTLEGYLEQGVARPIVDALCSADAGQCGYCLPGIATTLTVLSQRTGSPVSMDDLLRALDDHLCRCGSHSRILAAACAALGISDG